MRQEVWNDDSALHPASLLMSDFAHQTGLVGEGGPVRRYLWTDAFAVCNFLELFRRTGNNLYRRQAVSLISQVHAILGRHRDDDARQGWISGLSDEVAARHPTAGGLRIGKTLNERAENEPLDSSLEWDRDGQYFHYLSKWMHALNQAARVTGDKRYFLQSLELAKVAHSRFTYKPTGAAAPRMYWKMSIDLSRPLVSSMGHHDPIDALVTYRELQMTSRRLSTGRELPSLADEVADAEAMCAGQNWTTEDPLGIGGLLFDAYRVTQLCSSPVDLDVELVETLLHSADQGLQVFSNSSTLRERARFRLAFRELGLSIGLHALARMKMLLDEQWQQFRNGQRLARLVEHMRRFRHLCSAIESFWLNDANRQFESWTDHHDINTVMLATSLVPDGFLCIRGDGEVPQTASAHPRGQ